MVSSAIGFLLGGIFLGGIDKILPHLHPNAPINEAEGFRPKERKKSTLLVFAITLDNIPEGLVVGIAFGALVNGGNRSIISWCFDISPWNRYLKLPRRSCVSCP